MDYVLSTKEAQKKERIMALMRLPALSLTSNIVLQGERLIIFLLIRGLMEKANACFRKTLFSYVIEKNATLFDHISIAY